jgi:phage tail sheath protein FI
MGFQVSPGVEVKEIDLTNVIPAVSTSIGGYSGYFRWGPVNEIGLVGSEKELAGKFGVPDAAHTQSFLTAASFLKYGNALKVVRAGDAASGLLNAVAGEYLVFDGSIDTVVINSIPAEFSANITADTGLYVVEEGGTGNGATVAPRFDVNTITVADANSPVLTSGDGTESPLADFLDGEILTVYTTSGDNTTPAFTVAVTDVAGSPTFALAGGVLNTDLFDTFPTSTTGLAVYRADGTTEVVGLTVDATYKIVAVQVEAEGLDYIAANTTIGIAADKNASPLNIVEIEGSNFTFTQIDDDQAAPTFIANEEEFEYVYPATTEEALPGILFAKYAGELGNSLEAYVIDAFSWSLTPTGIQDQFDGAPEGDEVHVYVYDSRGEITGVANAELEKWSYLSSTAGAKREDGSNNNYQDVVNANSNYVYIARQPAGISVGNSSAYVFSGGADITNAGGDGFAGDIKDGLDVLADPEIVDVNLLFAQNEVSGSTVSDYLITVAATRKDAVAFVSPPISASTDNTPLDNVKNSIAGLPRGIEGSYGVFDSTALYVYNKYADNYVWIPACGHMAGLCAKTDDLAEPWFSPAGYNRGGLLGVTKLAFNPKQAERDELYKAGINPIVSFPGQGILLFGDKTAQAKPSAFDRINVRRLFIVLEKAIATAAKYQLFELNDEFTRAMFRNMTEPFLRDVKGRRGITDFLVVCDETNNTGEVIDTNRFVADIYIKPARSINFITLNFIATRTGVDFSEIVGK